MPSTPIKDDRLATPGSASSAEASRCWRSPMAWNDTLCGASVITWITPLSCTGKKSFFTARYSKPVSAMVASITIRAAVCRASTQVSARS